jgi:hypothetical protein
MDPSGFLFLFSGYKEMSTEVGRITLYNGN